MQQFLNYSRQLTTEEIEYLLNDPLAVPEKCPGIEQFKEQVCYTLPVHSTNVILHPWYIID